MATPNPNYEIDESRAAPYPYASEVHNGEHVTLQVKILNHARVPETYKLKWNIPPDWRLMEVDNKIAIIGPHGRRSAGGFYREWRGIARRNGRRFIRRSATPRMD